MTKPNILVLEKFYENAENSIFSIILAHISLTNRNVFNYTCRKVVKAIKNNLKTHKIHSFLCSEHKLAKAASLNKQISTCVT